MVFSIKFLSKSVGVIEIILHFEYHIKMILRMVVIVWGCVLLWLLLFGDECWSFRRCHILVDRYACFFKGFEDYISIEI